MSIFRSAPLTVLGLCAALVFTDSAASAAEAAAPVPKPVAKNAAAVVTSARGRAVPVATPLPVAKKESFWSRLFGGKKAASTPPPATPKPEIKPKPKATSPRSKPKLKPRSKPRVVQTQQKAAKQAESKTPEPEKTEETPEPIAPPKMEEKVKPTAVKPPKPKTSSKKAQNFPPAPEGADPDGETKDKYDAAKQKAQSDPEIQALRDKADGTLNETEARSALRTYNKALFRKIKDLDPSVKAHAEEMESAVLNRIGE